MTQTIARLVLASVAALTVLAPAASGVADARSAAAVARSSRLRRSSGPRARAPRRVLARTGTRGHAASAAPDASHGARFLAVAALAHASPTLREALALRRQLGVHVVFHAAHTYWDAATWTVYLHDGWEPTHDAPAFVHEMSHAQFYARGWWAKAVGSTRTGYRRGQALDESTSLAKEARTHLELYRAGLVSDRHPEDLYAVFERAARKTPFRDVARQSRRVRRDRRGMQPGAATFESGRRALEREYLQGRVNAGGSGRPYLEAWDQFWTEQNAVAKAAAPPDRGD